VFALLAGAPERSHTPLAAGATGVGDGQLRCAQVVCLQEAPDVGGVGGDV